MGSSTWARTRDLRINRRSVGSRCRPRQCSLSGVRTSNTFQPVSSISTGLARAPDRLLDIGKLSASNAGCSAVLFRRSRHSVLGRERPPSRGVSLYILAMLEPSSRNDWPEERRSCDWSTETVLRHRHRIEHFGSSRWGSTFNSDGKARTVYGGPQPQSSRNPTGVRSTTSPASISATSQTTPSPGVEGRVPSGSISACAGVP
jgi:hypothetical protein